MNWVENSKLTNASWSRPRADAPTLLATCQLAEHTLTAGLRADEDGDFTELQLGFLDDREVLDRQLSHRVLLPAILSSKPLFAAHAHRTHAAAHHVSC